MRRLGYPYNSPPIQSSGCDIRRYVEEAYRACWKEDGTPVIVEEAYRACWKEDGTPVIAFRVPRQGLFDQLYLCSDSAAQFNLLGRDDGDAQARTLKEKVETLALLYGKHAFPPISVTVPKGEGWWGRKWGDVREPGYTDHDSGDEAS